MTNSIKTEIGLQFHFVIMDAIKSIIEEENDKTKISAERLLPLLKFNKPIWEEINKKEDKEKQFLTSIRGNLSNLHLNKRALTNTLVRGQYAKSPTFNDYFKEVVLILEEDLELEVTFNDLPETIESFNEFNQLLESDKAEITILETRTMFLTWEQIQKLAYYIVTIGE